MLTVTIDILNDKALRLLDDLESLELIRVRKETAFSSTLADYGRKYKGAMSKQTIEEIDNQLNELRSEWE